MSIAAVDAVGNEVVVSALIGVVAVVAVGIVVMIVASVTVVVVSEGI